MDELEISGKRYISSRRAAKEHHYHTDYIGQMIRAGKIIGTKVGRAWYVDEESLVAYLHAESAIPHGGETHEHPARVRTVAPVATPHLTTRAVPQEPVRPVQHIYAPKLHYLADEEVSKPITPTEAPVESAPYIETVAKSLQIDVADTEKEEEEVVSMPITKRKMPSLAFFAAILGFVAFSAAAYVSVYGYVSVVVEGGSVQSATVLRH